MRRTILLGTALLVWPGLVLAADPIGQVKTSSGVVQVNRGSAPEALKVGDRVFQSDTVTTGDDGAVGLTFDDNSMMTLGPSSELVLDQFKFNTTTHAGTFESSLHKGTLAVKSGQIVQQTAEAMRVRTPTAILGVRGTEFLVRADGGK